MNRILQALHDLTWQAVALVAIAVAGIIATRFLPADVREWLTTGGGIVLLVQALRTDLFRSGTISSVRPPPAPLPTVIPVPETHDAAPDAEDTHEDTPAETPAAKHDA